MGSLSLKLGQTGHEKQPKIEYETQTAYCNCGSVKDFRASQSPKLNGTISPARLESASLLTNISLAERIYGHDGTKLDGYHVRIQDDPWSLSLGGLSG